MKFRLVFSKILIIVISSWSSFAWAEAVMVDKGVELSKEELTHALQFIPPYMTQKAIKDEAEQLKLVKQILVNKKIADAALNVTKEDNPDFYWKRVYFIQKALNDLFLKDYQKTLPTPDMTELAKEQYLVNKKKYAKVPEVRGSSHILFKCLPGACDRKELRPKVEKVMEELKQGANFEEMVEKYSGDINSKAKNGKVGDYRRGQAHVSDRYITGLFAIDKVGGLSEIVESKFGFHIIRLDHIKEAFYKPFEEIETELVEALEKKYKSLSMMNYLDSFDITEESKKNIDLINKVFLDKKEQLDLIEKNKPKPKNDFK